MSNDNNDHAMGKAVSGYRYSNWRMDGPPPLIVNPQADHHALLAWCWGEVQQISLLCQLHAGDEDNTAADLGGDDNIIFRQLPGQRFELLRGLSLGGGVLHIGDDAAPEVPRKGALAAVERPCNEHHL